MNESEVMKKLPKWQVGFEAEVQADCYDGEECDQVRKFWYAYAQGDKDGDSSETDLVFKCKDLPVGTKITVEYPECPKCKMFAQDCRCGFDWDGWIQDLYS